MASGNCTHYTSMETILPHPTLLDFVLDKKTKNVGKKKALGVKAGKPHLMILSTYPSLRLSEKSPKKPNLGSRGVEPPI